MRVVVSDTSPIRYLVLIGEADLLRKLYTQILIPQAVWTELQQPETPEPVRNWVRNSPEWVEVAPEVTAPIANSISLALDAGERAAIALALHLRADLLLIDERAGVSEARRLGLTVTGTLGILVRAAERGIVDLTSALNALQKTNFRASPDLLQQVLRDYPGKSES